MTLSFFDDDGNVAVALDTAAVVVVPTFFPFALLTTLFISVRPGLQMEVDEMDEEAPSFNGVDHSSVDGLEDYATADRERQGLLLAAAAAGDPSTATEMAMDVDLGATQASNGAAKTTAIAGLTAAAAG